MTKPGNVYNCAPLIWKKFSDTGKRVYNAVVEASLKPQRLINAHPASVQISDAVWATIVHNMACQAGWAAELNEKGEL